MHIFNKVTRELGLVLRGKKYCLILKMSVEILLANYNFLNIKIKKNISCVSAAIVTLKGNVLHIIFPWNQILAQFIIYKY